jgi:hypothetical protein
MNKQRDYIIYLLILKSIINYFSKKWFLECTLNGKVLTADIL